MEVYIGVIKKILDADLYHVEVDIPERGKGFKAYPLRGEVDEPRVGDIVFLRELDPDYHSYYLYEKLKENKFIGIRAKGKKIKITESEIEIGVYNENSEWYDNQDENIEDPTPECFASIKITDSGRIEINTSGEIKINGSIKMTGGKLTLGSGAWAVSDLESGGPFWCGGPTAPPAGTPGISGRTLFLGK